VTPLSRNARFLLADPAADIATATAATLAAAISAEPRHIVVEGGGARALRAASYSVSRYLTVPAAADPAVIVPVGAASPARYALREWLAPAGGPKRLRNRVAAELVARGLLPPGKGFALGTKTPGKPFLVAAAEHLGVPAMASWFLVPGAGDALSRGVFQLFDPGAREPAWALKFARVPGYEEPFARDEQGLRLAALAGSTAREHVPRLIGRFEAGGLPASLETAAIGQRLAAYLASGAGRHEKLRTIQQVAEWTIAIGAETAAPAARYTGERAELLEQIAAGWSGRGMPPASSTDLRSVPAVLEHRDLGSWNIVVGRGTFTVLDWEDATFAGFPLWDLWYLLADAIAHLDGAGTDGPEKERHFVQLFRGELPSSALLFSLTRRTVDALHLLESDVSGLALHAWLWHGIAHLARTEALERHAPGAAPARTASERRASLWLSEPGLGPNWSAWRG